MKLCVERRVIAGENGGMVFCARLLEIDLRMLLEDIYIGAGIYILYIYIYHIEQAPQQHINSEGKNGGQKSNK